MNSPRWATNPPSNAASGLPPRLGTPTVGNSSANSVHPSRSEAILNPPHLVEPTAPCAPVVPIHGESTYYLIKLATHDNQALFGAAVDGHLQLNTLGQVAADEWLRAAQANRGIILDHWEVMANQLQGIVMICEPITNSAYSPGMSSKPRLLSSFVAGYKAAAAKRINLIRNHPGSPVWQRSYQERLLADVSMVQQVRQLLSRPIAS
jgi:putative transposase